MKRFAMLALLFTGCASMERMANMGGLWPGLNVTDEMVAAACPSRTAFDAMVAEAEGYAERAQFRARVGMSACEVLATIGAPHETTMIETADGEASQWIYWQAPPPPSFAETMLETHDDSKEPRLIMLEPGEDRRGVVTSVVW